MSIELFTLSSPNIASQTTLITSFFTDDHFSLFWSVFLKTMNKKAVTTLKTDAFQ